MIIKCLKPVFEYKITFWIYVLALWIHKGYYVVKKLLGNVRIKAFWYTKWINPCISKLGSMKLPDIGP